MEAQQQDRVEHLTRCDQMMKDSRNAALSGVAALAATVALLKLTPTEVTDLLPTGMIHVHIMLVSVIIGASFASRQSILYATRKPSVGGKIETDTVNSWTRKSRNLLILGEIALAFAGGEIVIILSQKVPI